MITAKKWYESKILWAAVVTMLLGMVPLTLDLLKIILPNSITVVTAILTFISGMLTLIWRVFFTNQELN